MAPYGRAGASARVRVLAWVERLGLEVVSHDYLGLPHSRPTALLHDLPGLLAAERRIRDVASRSHATLLLHREASPLSRGAIEARLLGNAEHGVYDFDDALQWDHGRGMALRRWAPKSSKCLAAVRAADRVIAGNVVLAEWASEWARDVVVVPSCVDPASYPVKTEYGVHDPPRLGWIGSPTTERYLLAIAPSLLEVHRRTGARLTVISSGTASLGALTDMVDRVTWTESQVGTAMTQWDVALAPLADDLMARGKCAYKLLQYGAVGLPVVGSPVGVNRQVLDAFGGLAVDGVRPWTDALLSLLAASASELRHRGRTARDAVTKDYSYDAWASAWLAALELQPSTAP
ncbi:MAG: glycosyltransferase [Mycobacteriales bacterium]